MNKVIKGMMISVLLTQGVLVFSTVIAQTADLKDTTAMHRGDNALRSDTTIINLRNISAQLVTLRDSLGVEMMSIDKKMVNTVEPSVRMKLEKSKNKLSVYKAELEKLIEEITSSDASYINDVKKRAYRTVLDVRSDFRKIITDNKIVN